MKLPPLRLAGANFWPKKIHPSCQILTNLALCAVDVAATPGGPSSPCSLEQLPVNKQNKLCLIEAERYQKTEVPVFTGSGSVSIQD